MAQIIALGLVGGLVWYGYNALKKQMGKIGDELKDAEQKAAKSGKMKSVDELEKGPDGVYRPKDSHKDRKSS